MRIRHFLENWENTKTELLFCRIVILLLLLSTMAIIAFGKEDKTIIIPPEIDKTFWVKSSSVSSEYIEEMALFFTSLVLNVSPANVDYQHEAFLKYVDPQKYGAIKTRLTTIRNRIKRDGISKSFTAAEPEIEGSNVIIRGKTRIYVGSQETRLLEKAYKVVFTIKKGKIYVSDFIDIASDTGN